MTVDPLTDCEPEPFVESAFVGFEFLHCVSAVVDPSWLLGEVGVPVCCCVKFMLVVQRDHHKPKAPM